MRNRNENPKLSVLSLAVANALAVMFAMPMATQAAEPALEDEVAEIRRPTSYVEAGAAGISESSAKFGEYNGLNEHAAVIGNFGIRGGDAYQGGDGTTRWGVSGSNLGTTSRELGASVENQGTWSLQFGYDELRHNITDTYQTPQQGSMGGNTFTLPANFGFYGGATTATTTTVPPSTRAVPASALHTEEVGTTRRNTSLAAGLALGQNLNLKFDFNHLDQSGAKLMASAALGGIATGGVGNWRAEALSVLMNPTNYKTDNFNLGLNWASDKGHLSGGYHASIFRDGYDRMSWQNPIVNAAGDTAPPGVYQTVTMSTAPDNQLHQFYLSGGYALTPATKLTGGLSYGRNTQNDNFLTGLPEIVLSPSSSLTGKVITKHADVKLVNQAAKNLALSAALKYNERDNRTPSNIYSYYAINNITTVDRAANAPYSNRKTELELAGDLRLGSGQSIKLAYDFEKVNRWCNGYALAASCVVATDNTENKLGLTYRAKLGEAVRMNAGYAFARRTGTYDHDAITPLGGLDGTNSLRLVNAQDYPGFFAVTYSERKRHLLKAGVNWQAGERLEFGLDGRYADDEYDATLGVQSGKNASLTFDATFRPSDESSITAYLSWHQSDKEMFIGAAGAGAVNVGTSYAALVAPTNVWTNQLQEDGHAIGLATSYKLMGGKLDLSSDLSYSLDKSQYSTQVPYLATCSAADTLSCGTLPDIKSELLTFKLGGIYSLDRNAKLSVGYMYQKLKSDDYSYNWFQLGYTGTRGMPTNQVAPTYEVHLLAASYIYSFK